MVAKGTYVKTFVFGIVSLVILAYLAVILGDIRFTSTRDYHAMFVNVSQLRSGDQVRIAGVEVGKVDDVAIDGSQVKVSFNVDTGIDLDRSTRVVVRYKDLVGNRFIELQRGPTQRGPLGSGGTIPTTQTSAALNLDDLYNSFKPLFDGLDPAQINAVSKEIIGVLQGESGSVYQLLATLGSLTNTLADNDSLIGDTINNLSVALANIDEHSDTLSSLIVQLQNLVSGLNDDRTPILDAVDHIQGAAAEAAGLLSNVRAPLKADVTALNAVATTLNRGADTLQYTLTKLPHAYAVLARGGSFGAYFNFYLCTIRLQLTDGPNPLYTPYTYNPASRCK